MKNLIKRISSVVVAGALVLGSVAILPGTKKKVVYAAEPKYDSANLVNYATIMGRAVDYGIVSQSITQSMHMETTFATYSYSRTVDTTTDVDLTNAKTAQFIIGEVTSTGQLGTLKFGKVRTSTGDVFVENMSITLSEGMDPNRYIKYQDDVAQTTKFNYSYRTKKEIQESIDTVIDHARDESGEMVTRTGDADYVLDSTNNSLVSVNGSITTINIDDPKYDNKVVYINLDDAKFKNLLRAWAQEPNGHHLDINKRSSTVIVFTSAKKEAITLGKVSVYAKDSPLYSSAASTGVHDYDSYASVTTYSGNQSTHNAYVDKEIAQKLIWNITGSNDITISSNAGTFLCLAGDKTNRNVKVKLTGNPCAGWLVVNGNVENKCEYHYIYGGNSQSQGTEGEGQMHFVARKGFTTKYADKDHITPYVDNSVAFKEGDYQFFWQEYTDATFSKPVGQKSTVKVKDTSYMDFPTVTFVKNNPSDPHNVTAAGKNFYFRITEDPSKSLSGIKNSAGHIDVCLDAYVSDTGVIKFKMQSVTMIGADDSHLIQYDKNGTWGSSTDWVDVVNTRFDLGAFFNKIQVPGYMTITKTIEGDVTEEDLNGLTFTVTDGGAFTKVYKLGKDFTKNPTTGIYELTTPITVPDAETQYTVTETLYSLDGYKLEEVSYKVDGGAKKDSDEATLDSVSTDSGNPTTVAYTDSYTPLGTLTVKKTAKDDNNKTINYYYEFSVKNSAGQYLQADKKTFGAKEVFFTIGTDETVEFKDIPVDEYTITEKTNDLFVYGYTFEAASSITSGKADVTKKANTDFTLDNRFTMDRGSLTVKKTATDNNGNSVEGTFKFTISTPMRGYLQADGSFGNTIHYFTISDGESMTFDNLPVDNYNVTEDLNSVSVTGYTFNSTDSKYSVVGKVTKNGNTNAELVNKYTQDVGELRVTKTAQDNHNTNVSGSFEFSVKNSKGQYLQADKKTFDTTEVFFTVEAGSSKTFSDIPVGNYTVTEKTDSISVNGYTYTSTGSTTSVTKTVIKDATVEAELVNKFIQDLGSLTITKALGANAPSEGNSKAYTFTVEGPNGYIATVRIDGAGSETLTGLIPGSYTVTENGTGANGDAQISGYDLAVTGGGSVEVRANAVATTTVTNTYTEILGSLTVKKEVTGAPASAADKEFEFTVTGPNSYSETFKLKANETKTLTDLHLGTYTVTENGTGANGEAQISGYTLAVSGEDRVALTTAAVDGTATITNAYTEILGSLSVKKEVNGAPASAADKEFEFTVTGPNSYSETFKLKAGETKTLSDLKLGTYTVTENGTDANGDAQISGYTLAVSGEGDVELTTAAVDGTAIITNAYTEILGSLTVKKLVNGAPASAANKEFEFTVTGPNSYSETFKLKAGEAKTLTDLKLGTYTVTENGTAANGAAQIDGYTLVVSGEGDVDLTTASVDGSATVINDYTEILGSLTVKKEVTGAPASEADKDFEFTVTGPNGYSETFTLKNGETLFLNDLHLGTYTVTENKTDAAISGYDLVVSGEDNVELTTANKDASATVTNTYSDVKGSLTVKKTVTGAPASEANKEFEFTVTGPNNYSTTFKLKANETKTLTDLALGTYTVTENGTAANGDAQISGYTLAVSGEGRVALTTAAVDGTATITNAYTEILGSLTVKKEVNGAPASAADKEFEFTVTGPNSYSTTFKLKANETKTLTDLKLGTYTVTENGTGANGDAQISGYTLAVSGEGRVALTTAAVDGTATITNAYTEILGSLTVKKEVNGAPASAADKEFEFTVTGPNSYSTTFKLKANETKTLTDLALGTYTVTENETDAAISGYDLVVAGEGNVELTAANKDASATVTNTYSDVKGSLTVKKTVTGEPASAANKTYEFTVTGPNGYSETFTLKDGESKILSDLTLGTYTVTENGTGANGAAQISGYTLTVSGEGDVELTAANKDGSATVTNAYTEEKGSLTVKKTVTGAPASEANKEFEFTVTGPNSYSTTFKLKANETKTLTDLALGTYTVTENGTAANGDAQISGYTLAVSGEGRVALTTAAVDGTATITNAYTEILGSLTVKKTVTGAPASAADKEFEFTVTGPNSYSTTFKLKANETKTLSDLALGTYTVTENGTAANGSAQISGYDLVVSGEGNVELTTAAVDGTATITNAYTEILGSLTVKKTVTGAPASAADKEFEFTVTGPNSYSTTFKLRANETKTLSDLALGTYTVTENGTAANGDAQISGYTLAVTGEGDVALTTAAVDGTATITNAYTELLGSLTIKKEVTGAPASEANKTFEFTVEGPNNYIATVALKANESMTLRDLPLGTYKVTENGTGANGSAQISGYDLVVTGEGDVELTASAKDGSAEITNAYSNVKGSLTVKKTVTGAPTTAADKEFEFTVTGPNSYSETFKLKANETKTLTDLALGTYTVTENGTGANGEAQISGYVLTVTGEGDVELTAANKDGSATVTNAYTEEVKGSLKVTKTVTGAPASAVDKEFEFTVTGPNSYSETFKLKNGETKTLTDLALGTYTVTESSTSAQIIGYRVAVSGAGDVELTSANKDGSADVTNTYTETNEKTSATVQKVWDDNNNQNGDRPVNLTVTLSNGQQVVLDDSNGWTATVSDLPKYENGSEIVYTWTEEQVQGYRLSSSVKDQNDPTKTIITNAYDASSVLTSATVKKVWDDNSNAAGLRPSSLVVNLFQNGTQIDTCTLNEQNGWTATVNNLAKYDASNTEYVYTWTEEQISVTGYAQDSVTVSDTTTTITNKYTAPAPVLGSLKIKKVLAAGAPTDASNKTYQFTVTGTKGYTTTVDIQGEGEVVLDNLELDTYTITENTASADIDGYTLSVTNNGASVVIGSANQEECVITNTYKKESQPTQPDPTSSTPTGTDPTGTEPTGTKPSGTKPTDESPYSEEQAPSETTPTPAPAKKIEGVTIDDKPVNPDDYTEKPDGTVEFSSKTIEGLTLGVHRALIKYNDGTTITVEFEVVSSAGRGRTVVKTGDTAKSNLVPAAAFLSIAVAAVAIVIFRKRRFERDAK